PICEQGHVRDAGARLPLQQARGQNLPWGEPHGLPHTRRDLTGLVDKLEAWRQRPTYTCKAFGILENVARVETTDRVPPREKIEPAWRIQKKYDPRGINRNERTRFVAVLR